MRVFNWVADPQRGLRKFRTNGVVITLLSVAALAAVPTLCAADATPWLVSDIELLTGPPDDNVTALELADLQQRQTQLNDDKLANISRWANNTPNHHWLQVLLEKHIDIGPPSPKKGRAITLLNLAIYDAVAVATTAKSMYNRTRPAINGSAAVIAPTTSSYPSAHAAAATVASEVLSYLLPEHTETFQQMALSAKEALLDAGLNYPTDIEAGDRIGLEVAQQIIEYAKNDNSDASFSGTRPVGPQYLKGEKFVYPAAGDTKPVSIKSVNPYIPGAPPAFDSEEMAAELDMLKAMERPLPKKMLAWTQHSTISAYRWWYEQIALAMFERGMQTDALKSAHIYATVSAINHDALTACFKAKYTYWQIRPSQLDNMIETTFPNPPHPSYPSAHSCSSTAYGITASHFFPEKKSTFSAAAEAGGLSRLIAGIHYPSDDQAGDAIGAGVAEEGLAYSLGLLTTTH